MMDLHFQYRIGVSTISYIIRDICSAIWRKMKSKCFPDLSKDLWLTSAEGFHKRANFPHCVGAVDGKRIRIVKPTSSGSLYYHYKNYFSILLLAVCDSTYKFLFIDVGACGKSSDSTVFRNTVLNNKLQDGTLDLPAPKQLSLSFERPMPFMLVGDEGFGLSKFILRPYGGKYLDNKKHVVNYRLCRARR
ncbi:protein ALP1-like [Schistocerca americana]|uniref:protein ALP1-like n=1 Tax=Schistocerca americana TaxID=7009 RepID=UPI001F4F5EF2|nr:protein ALP1-like [Schistocerca americana]